MADTLQIQAYDGARNYQVKVVSVSDGTGLTGAVIVDGTALAVNPLGHWKIRRIKYSILNLYLRLQWDGATAKDIAYLGQGEDILDFTKTYAGGYPNNAVTPTGKIIATTSAQILGSGFTLEIELIKGIQGIAGN